MTPTGHIETVHQLGDHRSCGSTGVCFRPSWWESRGDEVPTYLSNLCRQMVSLTVFAIHQGRCPYPGRRDSVVYCSVVGGLSRPTGTGRNSPRRLDLHTHPLMRGRCWVCSGRGNGRERILPVYMVGLKAHVDHPEVA